MQARTFVVDDAREVLAVQRPIITDALLDALTLADADELAEGISSADCLSPTDKMLMLAELSDAVEPLLYVA